MNETMRAAARDSFTRFCEIYAENDFRAPFRERAWQRHRQLEAAVIRRRRERLTVVRGEGLTTELRWVTIWAALNGWGRYVVLVANDPGQAMHWLATVRRSILSSPRLAEDFPEPFEALFSQLHRAHASPRPEAGRGRRFQLSWDSPDGRGFIVSTCTVWDGVAGVSQSLYPSGEIIRPDLVIFEATSPLHSPTMEARRDDRQAVLHDIAGPGLPCGVIHPVRVEPVGITARRALDEAGFPGWGRGEREATAFMRQMRSLLDESPYPPERFDRICVRCKRPAEGPLEALGWACPQCGLLGTAGYFWTYELRPEIDLTDPGA